MGNQPKQVLFLCTGNSARSVLSEALLNDKGQGRFKAYSAGSKPTGAVNPLTLRLLADKGYDTGFARSKSWDEFAGPNAMPSDFVITVCDSAAGETCPIWPGHPMSAHWGVPDPAAVEGDEATRMSAFEAAYAQLERRVEAFLALPMDTLEGDALKKAIAKIGQMDDA